MSQARLFVFLAAVFYGVYLIHIFAVQREMQLLRIAGKFDATSTACTPVPFKSSNEFSFIHPSLKLEKTCLVSRVETSIFDNTWKKEVSIILVGTFTATSIVTRVWGWNYWSDWVKALCNPAHLKEVYNASFNAVRGNYAANIKSQNNWRSAKPNQRRTVLSRARTHS